MGPAGIVGACVVWAGVDVAGMLAVISAGVTRICAMRSASGKPGAPVLPVARGAIGGGAVWSVRAGARMSVRSVSDVSLAGEMQIRCQALASAATAGQCGAVLCVGAGAVQRAAGFVGARVEHGLTARLMRQIGLERAAFLAGLRHLAAGVLKMLHQRAAHELRGVQLSARHRLGGGLRGLLKQAAKTVGHVELLYLAVP